MLFVLQNPDMMSKEPTESLTRIITIAPVVGFLTPLLIYIDPQVMEWMSPHTLYIFKQTNKMCNLKKTVDILHPSFLLT